MEAEKRMTQMYEEMKRQQSQMLKQEDLI